MKSVRAQIPIPLFVCFTAALFALWLHGTGTALASTCMTGDCHAQMGQEAFVHGPVAVGECTFCHQPEGDHEFAPIRNVGELCGECHDKLDSKGVVHQPVKEGSCTDCHDPHQSANRYQLREAGEKLCFTCHDPGMADNRYVHGPVAVGSCTTCHQVHQSDYPKMLIAEGNDVCVACHADKADEIADARFAHYPVTDSCVSCHDPHGGRYPFNFAVEGSQDLCFECHIDKKEEIAAAKVHHGGLDTKKKCLACHTPHTSNYVRQLRDQPAELCLGCHDREYNGRKGQLKNMKEHLQQNPMHHGPIEQNDCSSCHNAHGSNYFRILRMNFEPVFYAPYNPENFELCFMCHENTLAADPLTTTLTGFRNGDQNLHYVHVNKSVKGRTCRACHDAHATSNPRHIRDAVPFNAWQLPVGFTKNENGGTCLPGCHQEFAYDRINAVKNR